MSTPTPTLSTANHDRDSAGMTYVYPVISRRAGGVSVGINLNPNNACNWRCIYCQVPNLSRGGPPAIDLALLEEELRRMLADIVDGDFMARVPEPMRRLNDIALSGNGEPTSAPEFPAAVELIGRVLVDFKLADFGLSGKIKLVLISNGSLAHKAYVQAGLRKMAALNGEVWFKFDRATRAGLHLANDTETDPERHYQRLKSVANLCPTWMQTCMFALDGVAPEAAEIDAWLALLTRARAENLPLRGVLLYGLARPSLQAEAPRLSRLSEDWMRALAAQVEALGWTVKVSV
ncbi:MAG: radical SAM protein [Pseudomonadota bacterium]|nr:radical SAM protein [Pseudomonadota bacterium]